MAFPEPWAYWKFEESAESTRMDATGHGHDLTADPTQHPWPYGTNETPDPSPEYPKRYIPGKIGAAVQLYWYGQWCGREEENLPSLRQNGFTLAGWIRCEGVGGSLALCGIEFEYLTEWWADEEALWLYLWQSYPASTIELHAHIQKNEWVFVVAWFDPSDNSINFQCNMGDIQSATVTAWSPMYEDWLLFQGEVYDDTWPLNSYGRSQYDEWGIWDTVLSAGQRFYLYNSGAGRTYPFTSDSAPLYLVLPGNTEGYLTTTRNTFKDTFDVNAFTYNYGVVVSGEFPYPWAYWKFDDAGGSDGSEDRLDSTTNNRNFPVMTGRWPPSAVTMATGGGGWQGSGEGIEYGLYDQSDALVTNTNYSTTGSDIPQEDVDLMGFNWVWGENPDTSKTYRVRYRFYNSGTGWGSWQEVGASVFQQDSDAEPPWKQIGSGTQFKELYEVYFRHSVTFSEDGFSWVAGLSYRYIPRAEPSSLYPDCEVGKVGNSLTSTLIGQGIERVNNNLPFNGSGTDPFTYAVWINATNEVVINGDCDIDFVKSGEKYAIRAVAGNLFVLSSYSYDPSTWYFIVAYYDGTALRLEVNGVAVGSDVGAHGITTGQSILSFQSKNLYESTPSYIDEFGIWTVALTAEQRDYLYNSGTGRTFPFV